MKLQYKVANQKLRPKGIQPSVISDSIDFIHLYITLDAQWQGMVAVAQFTQGEQTLHQVLDEDGHCTLPSELKAGTAELMIFGQVPGETSRATTNSIEIIIGDSGFMEDGEAPIPPTADLYSQLLEQLVTQDEGATYIPAMTVTKVDGCTTITNTWTNNKEASNPDPVVYIVMDGVDGADGADGADGQDGADGATGAQGEKGDTGETGATGATGADGQDGTNGIDGLTTSVTLNGTTTTHVNGNIDLGNLFVEATDEDTAVSLSASNANVLYFWEES